MQENAFHIVWALIWNGSLTFAMEKSVPAMILPWKDGEGWQNRVTRIKGIVKKIKYWNDQFMERFSSWKFKFWNDQAMGRSRHGKTKLQVVGEPSKWKNWAIKVTNYKKWPS